MKNCFLPFLMLCLYSFSVTAQSSLMPMKKTVDTNFQPKRILEIMDRVATWQMQEFDKGRNRWPKWDWTNGALYTGLVEAGKLSNDEKYFQFLKKTGRALNWNTGPQRLFGDDYCVAQMYSQLYEIFKQPEMIQHFILQADSIVARPHNESLLWVNDVHLREWAWCDALFMAPPALAYLSTATGDMKYLQTADKLWWKTTDYLFDTTEHLYFRDSKYFNSNEANGKKMFWARGNGWVMGGLVRMLENMPKDFPGRTRYEDLFRKMAKKIASIQHVDGTWHTALLDPESYVSKETSGTGFYVYAFTWGIRHGLISYDEYFPVVSKAWDALVTSVHPDGKLGYVQKIGEKPGAVDYNSTEVYGVGAFLLSGSQLYQLMMEWKLGNGAIRLTITGTASSTDLLELNYATLVNKLSKETPKNKKALSSSAKLTSFNLKDGLTGVQIPYQIEYDTTHRPFRVLIQPGLVAGTSHYLSIERGRPGTINSKVYGRQVPERFDDFAWENDRIAFRMYGKILKKEGDITSGLDVWSKRTDKLVVDNWYKKNDYHKDSGEGLDFYKVSPGLGSGGIAPYANGAVVNGGNYTSYKILQTGPLRFQFQLEYNVPWNAGEATSITEMKTITLDAGSQLNKIETQYFWSGTDTLVAAIGVNKRIDPGQLYFDESSGIISYWEPPFSDNGTIGVGVISLTPYQLLTDAENILGLVKIKKGKSFIYYAGAAWNKAGYYKTSAQWIDYLLHLKKGVGQIKCLIE